MSKRSAYVQVMTVSISVSVVLFMAQVSIILISDIIIFIDGKGVEIMDTVKTTLLLLYYSYQAHHSLMHPQRLGCTT